MKIHIVLENEVEQQNAIKCGGKALYAETVACGELTLRELLLVTESSNQLSF